MTQPDKRTSCDATGSAPSTVNELFDDEARYWHDVYADPGIDGEIFRARQEQALAWLGRPSADESILEVGSGAGRLTVALRGRGFRVVAIDASREMVSQTRETTSKDESTAAPILVADVHQLPFKAGAFDSAAALGVLPWLHDRDRALSELARVIRRDGRMVVTSDNRLRMNYLLDPRQVPALHRARRAVKAQLAARGWRRAAPESHVTNRLDRNRDTERAVERAGFDVESSVTIGFGPFTLWGRRLLAERTGVRLHRRLQRFADRGVPVVARAGSQFVVLARRR